MWTMTRESDKQVTKSLKALREIVAQLVIMNKAILSISSNIQLLTTRRVREKRSQAEGER